MSKPKTLPRPASSFIGRERDLADLDALFGAAPASAGSLVTLVGPAGVGKTRLALQAAARWEQRTRRAALFVDLSTASDATDVLAKTLTARGLAADATDEAGFERLARANARGRSLMVLDNAEHVIDAVARLVVRARGLGASFLVTSRRPLSVEGELVQEVAPLSVEEGIRLFEARAALRASVPAAERAAVSAIVAALENLPLGIELAAARATVLLPSEIEQHLSRSLSFLGGNRRDAPSRHASLHAAIAWSFDCLDAAEQRALVQCAAFHDGFTAAAAEHVIDAEQGRSSLDLLQSLREQSLVRSEVDPRAPTETRYRLYESVRAFAASLLDASPDRDAIISRHATYFEALATRLDAASRLHGIPGEALVELPNILAAARRAVPRAAARIAVAVAPMLATCASVEKRLALLDPAVTALESTAEPDGANVSRVLLASALVARGQALLLAARLDDASADARRALAIAREDFAPEAEAAAELLLARVAVDRANLADARDHAQRAVAQIRGDRRCRALQVLGFIETQMGDLAAAKESLSRALAASQDCRDRMTEAAVLSALGELAQAGGQPRDAEGLHERSALVAREAGDRATAALAGLNRTYALCELAEYPRAAHYALESIAVVRELGDQRLEVIGTSALGFARQGEGRLDEALELTTRALAIPAGDYAAAIARLCHAAVLAERGSLLEARAIFDALLAAIAGNPGHTLGAVLEPAQLLLDLGAAIACARAGDRERAAACSARVREAVTRWRSAGGIGNPDARIWWVFVSQALERHALLFGATTCRLEIAPSGAWFKRDDRARVACGQRPVIRRLLVALARARLHAPGKAVPVTTLVGSLWPGEKMREASARRRLQVAVSRLRELGLGGVVMNEKDGYLLVDTADVTVAHAD